MSSVDCEFFIHEQRILDRKKQMKKEKQKSSKEKKKECVRHSQT